MPPEPEQPQHEGNHWHLKKEIQLGHLITTLTIAAAVVIYVQKIEQRIALVEQSLSVQADRDNRQDQSNADATNRLRQQLERMDAKLDRIIERSAK